MATTKRAPTQEPKPEVREAPKPPEPKEPVDLPTGARSHPPS